MGFSIFIIIEVSSVQYIQIFLYTVTYTYYIAANWNSCCSILRILIGCFGSLHPRVAFFFKEEPFVNSAKGLSKKISCL